MTTNGRVETFVGKKVSSDGRVTRVFDDDDRQHHTRLSSHSTRVGQTPESPDPDEGGRSYPDVLQMQFERTGQIDPDRLYNIIDQSCVECKDQQLEHLLSQLPARIDVRHHALSLRAAQRGCVK